MASRYTIVDEPEAMELDDEVYRSGITIEDFSGSTRSLDPIIPGPIGLKTIFYDPRWSPRQRFCCLTVAVVITCCCLAVLIALFVGLGQVIAYINRSDRLKASGLYMVPDLDMHDISVLVYHPDEKYKPLRSTYIDEMSRYLEVYRNQSSELRDCDLSTSTGKNKICRFDVSWLGDNCTSSNGYGFATGNPCVLFVLRNVGHWIPVLSEPFLNSLKEADPTEQNRQFDMNHIPISCSVMRMGDIVEPKDGEQMFNYFPDSGFNVTFLYEHSMLPPLVFVQIAQPHRFSELHIRCQIAADNIRELEGIHSIEFEYNNPQPDVQEKIPVV
ncbi:sodium:potassium transporting ATPase [Trichuris trichiura]|uniref:Sodium:potassium transporting ATPase n=1 Tax=Trichuris trichiura TaxID=36087 RepID=A0A077ZD37_TRITR|nr:sodium:potassium transporting ATPase [Trichuris trichiura]